VPRRCDYGYWLPLILVGNIHAISQQQNSKH
jgi:hypothetical protein